MRVTFAAIATITALAQKPYASAEEKDVMLHHLASKLEQLETDNAEMKAEITKMKERDAKMEEREAKLASLISPNGKTNLRRLDGHGDGSYELLYLYLQSFHDKYEKFEDVHKCLDHSIVDGKDVCTLGGSTGIDAVLIGSAGPNKPDIKIDGNEVDTNALSSVGTTAGGPVSVTSTTNNVNIEANVAVDITSITNNVNIVAVEVVNISGPTVVTNTESCSGSCFDDVNPCLAYNNETDTCTIGNSQDPPNIVLSGDNIAVDANKNIDLNADIDNNGSGDVYTTGASTPGGNLLSGDLNAGISECVGYDAGTDTCTIGGAPDVDNILIGNQQDLPTIDLYGSNINVAATEFLNLVGLGKGVKIGSNDDIEINAPFVEVKGTGNSIAVGSGNNITLKSVADINLNANLDVNLNGDADNVGGGDVYAKTGGATREVVCRGTSCP